MSLTVAFDVGTSGTRAAAVDEDGALVARARVIGTDRRRADGTVDPRPWRARAEGALAALIAALRERGRWAEEIGAITADGTSGTVVLVDAVGNAVSPGLMYDSAHGTAADRAGALLPLARGPAAHVAHQTDFVLTLLGARPGTTDPNNALKTGHDPVAGWPDALREGPLGPLLPRVRPLHAPIGTASPAARALGVPASATIHAGTTDSVAAFLAAGPRAPGEAVTSLGSTTVLKLVSPVRVDDPARGAYSHPLGDLWLAGGASNAGGAGIAAALPGADLAALSAKIAPDVPSPLDYHPLPRPGERFPEPDPDLPPRTAPRPADDALFLHGLLESVARIEARGYAALAALGAPALRHVLTAGGGAANPGWTAIRARVLGVPVAAAPETDAATGLARALARHRS
ncbi:hypothetical protein BCF33_1968 [Hasllibacter halocynthiae]|uniref:Carbohydrate kinase FGGY C-terminal domain-containing protein n=1 Tax=Hasllibacter halocynthiae TaxID=595589 RepID=A0A2T0X2C2_9RHOB|nr:FGGY-family carbohydrate kinase [Hasllibacter halocynthiae]PRY93102.1 hypothetical protein BCF33_1968 [Hasllibacter halocynthiae]